MFKNKNTDEGTLDTKKDPKKKKSRKAGGGGGGWTKTYDRQRPTARKGRDDEAHNLLRRQRKRTLNQPRKKK